MNGMVQFVIEDRNPLLKIASSVDITDTLMDTQKCHHVTLQFKPKDIKFQEGITGVFNFKSLRVDDNIAAIFGDIVFDNGNRILNKHVTIKGKVSPVMSNNLTSEHIVTTLTGEVRGVVSFVLFSTD